MVDVKSDTKSGLAITDQAYKKLEEMFAIAILVPKMMYNEKELSEMIGINRTPVREALLRLEQEGMVSIIPRQGIRTSDVDHDSMYQLTEVRRPLQRKAVELAVQRASKAHREEMRKFAHELSKYKPGKVPNKLELLDLIRTSHLFVANSSDNVFMAKTLTIVQSLSRRYWLYYVRASDVKKSLNLHCELLNAIADGDKSKALKLSDRQIDYLEEYVAQVISRGSNDSFTSGDSADHADVGQKIRAKR